MASTKKEGRAAAASRKKKGKKKRVAAAKSKLTMKLLVDTTTQRVLCAEAGKDAVDFLFSLLTLPLATVANLLAPARSMVGSVGNLYGSVENLDDGYICRDDAKAALLAPDGRGESAKLLQLDPGAVSGGAGFVHGAVTYMVMDDLGVAPMSTISGITLLNTLGVTDVGSLLEKTVEIGNAEGLEILRASLRSKKVLTDVFLGKKKRKVGGDGFLREVASRAAPRSGPWPAGGSCRSSTVRCRP